MLKARLNFFAVLWFVDRLLLAAGKDKRDIHKTKVVKSTFMIASSLTKSKGINARCSDNPVLQLGSALQ